MKILIIDDNKNITTMLSKYLTLKKHDCVASNDGRNAVNIIQQSSFDVIILDLAMPEFTGYDVIKTLEERSLLNKQRIVVMSALDISKEESEKLYEKNITLLRKPVQLQELLESLASE